MEDTRKCAGLSLLAITDSIKCSHMRKFQIKSEIIHYSNTAEEQNALVNMIKITNVTSLG